MEKEAKEQISEVSSDITKNVQSVKLQKYTITPLEPGYTDCTRFWNSCTIG